MKRMFLVLGSAALVFLVYYFFFRPFEFEVNFKANTLPGDIIETIRIWDRSQDSLEVSSVESLKSLHQRVRYKDRQYEFDWRFDKIEDTVTQVNVRISQPGREFMNKLLVPFSQPDIEKDAAKIVSGFYRALTMHLEITSVKVLGPGELQPSFCVCRTLETAQTDKANGMMQDFSLLTSFVNEFNLQPDGPPNVRITEWDHDKNKLKYDFCFPVVKHDSLPLFAEIYYKEFPAVKALKAEYHGNYITSDRAWYALQQYAKDNGFKVDGLPIEYFFDNPNTGMNEREWKAEVYLPIKIESELPGRQKTD